MVSTDHQFRPLDASPVPEIDFSVLFDEADDVLRVTGELEGETAAVFAGVVAGQIAHRRVDLRLDLSGLTFFDLHGLDALCAAHRSLQLCGGGLRIVRSGPLLRAVADILGQQHLFEATPMEGPPLHAGVTEGPSVERLAGMDPARRPPADAG